MSLKNTEGTLLDTLGDWLHCTKEKESETFMTCSIRDIRKKKGETRELQGRTIWIKFPEEISIHQGQNQKSRECSQRAVSKESLTCG